MAATEQRPTSNKKIKGWVIGIGILLILFFSLSGEPAVSNGDRYSITTSTKRTIPINGPFKIDIEPKNLRYKVYVNGNMDSYHQMPTNEREHFFGNNITSLGVQLDPGQKYSKAEIIVTPGIMRK